MPLDFKDYQNQVAEAYRQMKNAGTLSNLLVQPSTDDLRKSCFNVYNQRKLKGEEELNTLEAFFGIPDSGKNYSTLIEWYPLDKFRPLRKLILGGVKNPSIVNVELLAWLIDFRPRPLARAQQEFEKKDNSVNQPGSKKEQDPVEPTGGTPEEFPASTGNKDEPGTVDATTVINTQGSSPGKKEEIVVEKEKEWGIIHTIISRIKGWKKIYKTAVIVFVSLLVSCGGIYLYSKHDRSEQIPFGGGNTGCMYWADDHYEKVPCNEEQKGRLILPLDEEKMRNFRKITREDTITEWSIGKIYYLKDNRVLEYYTTGGNHPVDVTRTLKVLSRHMFDTYLRKKEASGKDSLVESNKKP